MRQPQRYTGPELGPLLREVRTELGEQATIHEANRIREGGVAGFFRREAFEVLASSPASAASAGAVVSWDAPTNDWLDSDDNRIEPSITGRGLRHRRRKNRRADSMESADTLTADDDLVAKLTAAMESEQAWAQTIGTPSPMGTAVTEPAPLPTPRLPPRRFSPEDLAPLPDESVTSLATALLETPALETAPLGQTPLPQTTGDPTGEQARGNRLLERADSVSTQDRVGLLLAGAQELINDRSLARRTTIDVDPSRPASTNPSHPQLAEPRELQPEPASSSPTAADDELAVPVQSEPTVSNPTPVASAPSFAPATTPRSRAVATDSAQLESDSTPSIERAPTRTASLRSELFWGDLAELEEFLPVRPAACANVQLLVGPLDVAMPLASRFANDASVELHVLSDEARLVGVEPQQMAETSRDLSVRLGKRTRAERRAVGVVEADDSRRGDGEPLDRMLPPRLLTLIDRICTDGGVDLLRLTLRSLAPVEEMTALVNSFPVPCAIDLALAPDPAVLDAALTARLPIVSVAGRQLTPALAMALKKS